MSARLKQGSSLSRRSERAKRGPARPRRARSARARPAPVRPRRARSAKARPAPARPRRAKSAKARPEPARPLRAKSAKARPEPARPLRAKSAKARPEPARPLKAKSAKARRENASRISENLVRRGHRENLNFNIDVGAALPVDVELLPLPPDVVELAPDYRGYDYVVDNDEIVFVDPATRAVVGMIELGASSADAGPPSSIAGARPCPVD